MNYLQNLQHTYAQATWRKQLQFIGAFSLALVLLWTVAALYLDVTTRAAATGREIQALQVRSGSYSLTSLINRSEDDLLSIEELRQINRDLETRLAYLTSEEVMRARAEKLGFELIDTATILYLQVPGYIPRQVAQLAPPPGPGTVNYPTAPPVPESMLTWLNERYLETLELVQGARP
ncbi:MAG: hypothetical protein ACOYYS_05260 [Chloroflexota bacterium]